MIKSQIKTVNDIKIFRGEILPYLVLYFVILNMERSKYHIKTFGYRSKKKSLYSDYVKINNIL